MLISLCYRRLIFACALKDYLTLLFLFVQETFERAKAWVKELQRQASPNIVIALAGNKADLAEKRLVEYEVTRGLMLLQCRKHLETSFREFEAE